MAFDVAGDITGTRVVYWSEPCLVCENDSSRFNRLYSRLRPAFYCHRVCPGGSQQDMSLLLEKAFLN
jgi:hypothetical protein